MEVDDGDATLDVKITPAVGPDSALRFDSEINRVEAQGFLHDLLRSGDLGATLRKQIASTVLNATRGAADIRAALPPVAQESATLQRVEFQDAGSDQLKLSLEGQVQLSEEQTQQFAAQLKQSLSAQSPAR
jgi:hypothetical protein